MARALFFLILLLSCAPTFAAALEVGPDKPLTTLSAALAAAQDGDTINVQPGSYAGGWVTRNNLTLNCTAPRACIVEGTITRDKGLILQSGDNLTVKGFTFRGAASRYVTNAAGIRVDGAGLTVINCLFEKNANGILYTAVNKVDWKLGGAPAGQRGTLTVNDSSFIGNGYGDGQTHGIYASIVDKVVVFRSTFRDTRVGHHLKSRAHDTTVTFSTFEDGPIMDASSYAIDLPQGGAALIHHNTFGKGSYGVWLPDAAGIMRYQVPGYSSNASTIIAYGFEMAKKLDGTMSTVNPPGPVVVTENFVVSRINGPTVFFRNRSVPRNTKVTFKGNKLTRQATLSLQGS